MCEPMQFFHFASFFFIAHGIGNAIRMLISLDRILAGALMTLAFGIGALAGVALSTVVFRSKMRRVASA
jgi:hypothetical protein